ncbi:MAG: hypothetical protein Fur0016_00020 [Anaerolineales bacterium]
MQPQNARFVLQLELCIFKVFLYLQILFAALAKLFPIVIFTSQLLITDINYTQDYQKFNELRNVS